MDFAKKQLEKYGWRDGKGLGRNEDGISEALKATLKFDNAGIGHQVGDQFTNNWWERLFNNASKNINVKVEEDEVKLQLNSEPVEITTKNYSLKKLKKNEHLQYGSFLKTAKITQNGTQSYDVALPEALPSFTNLTDDELFAACGGRTAHKGARHGLKLSGKLSRIEKQEKFLLKKMKNVSLADDTPLEKKMKKLKKHKEETITDTIDESEGSSSSSHKKKKNKRKSVTFNNETIVKYYTPDLDTSHESNKDENSNSQVLTDPNSNDEGIEQDIEESGNDQNDHSSFEEPQRTFSDLSKAERKKLKKKRKLENKKTATSQFIEEVRDTMCLEENCKKRKLLEGFDELDLEKQKKVKEYSKKKKYVPEKLRKKEEKRERKMMKSIVQSMDNFCRISDDE